MPRVSFFRRARPRGVPIAELYRDLLARWSRGNTVVDVGCMWNVDGAHAFHAADQGATRVVGLDIEPATPAFVAENAARAAAGRRRVEFIQGDVNDPALGIGPFDVVFCAGVLYHVPDPVFTLRRLRALCTSTLILGTTVFPEQSTPQTAVFLPGLETRARERLTYATRGVKRGLDSDFEPEKGYGNWFWGLSPSAVLAMLRLAGFDVVEHHPYPRFLCAVAIARPDAPR